MNDTDIRTFEVLSEKSYNSANKDERTAAQKQLESLFDSLDCVPRLQIILQTTKNPFALFFCCNRLLKLFTDHWNAFNKKQKNDMRNFLINFLGQNGASVPQFAQTSMLQLLGRLTKLGWLEDTSNMELPEQIKKYFVVIQNPPLAVVGLSILNSMIQEMNMLTQKRSLSHHRKIAVSFRDHSLKGIFETSLTVLNELLRLLGTNVRSMTPEIQKLCNEALSVSLECLKFDFVGIFPDESTEDIGTLQVPSQWKNIFEEANTIELFFNLYTVLTPAAGQSKAMQQLVNLSSIRRSLFSGDESRQMYLEKLIDGIVLILQQQTGLAVQENYHEFCRLVSRLKSNFQLNEFVSCKNYNMWLELIAKFSIESFKSWQFSSGSIFYLLNLWSRLISSVPYLKTNAPSHLETFVPELCKHYIMSRMESAASVARGDADDDTLENEQALEEQLEVIPQIVHANYEASGQFYVSIFDPLFVKYQQSIQSRNQLDMRICEGQLAWLVYMFGAVIGKRFVSSTSSTEESETIDANLAARVLRCISLVAERLQIDISAVQEQSVQRLELAVLYFLKAFKRVYLGDTMLNYQHAYQRLRELLNLGDQLSLLNVYVNKIAGNLKIWAKSEKIVSETITLFDDIATGFTSGKNVVQLDLTRFILTNHGMENFPFMQVPQNMRQRTVFYRTLCKLLFLQNCSDEQFEEFMQPLTRVCAQLEAIQSIEQFRQNDVRFVLMGLLRDMRGICSACLNKKSYLNFFEWFFPQHFMLIIRAIQVWFTDAQMMNALLKFLAELTMNKNSRIQFGSSSPNGILLFKRSSELIVSFGKLLADRPVVSDVYTEKYKLVMLCVDILCNCLSGSYCNFGVFELYNDKALVDVLDTVLGLSLKIPLADVLHYPKLCKAFFSLVEILFHNHVDMVIQFPTPVFLKLVEALEEGVQLEDVNLSSQICSALDYLLSFYYKCLKKDPAKARRLEEHMAQNKTIFPRILNKLINLIAFEECQNQWSISRAILALIVTHRPFFEELKRQMSSSLGGDRQEKMQEAFAKLMDGVDNDLESKTRDRFTSNLITFRQEVRQFL